MQVYLERQLEELECLEAMYPDELSVNTASVKAAKKFIATPENGADTTPPCPPLSFTITLAKSAKSIGHTKDLEWVTPCITIEFPPEYPASSPPVVSNTVALDDDLRNLIHQCLEDTAQGEECTVQLLMSLNEHVDTRNERTIREHAMGAPKREGTKPHQQVVPEPAPMLGRRVINSPYILKPAKIKDLKKCADELNLGGYAKIGKPGIIVIEGPEEGCRQYCPMLQDLGWKYQTVQGEQQQEVVTGESLDELRVLPREFRVLPLGTDSLSEVSQLCREAGESLADLFFTSLNIHNSVKDVSGDSSKGKTLEKKRGKKSGGKR